METKRFCDCIYFDGKFWQQNCECRNSGDMISAQRWCDQANKEGFTDHSRKSEGPK